MNQIHLTFHGNLVYFLKKENPENTCILPFREKTAVKHMIETQGVPHSEVGRILCNNSEVDLQYSVRDNDKFHVFPWERKDISATAGEIRFILDNHLGKLMIYLRILGFDVVYAQNWPDKAIAYYSLSDNRILLTRDRGLLMRKIVSRGYCVRADLPLDQLKEVVELFGRSHRTKPFHRCPRCNGLLYPVLKEDVLHQLLPLTRLYYDEFNRCENCQQIYWKGSHFDRIHSVMSPFIDGNLEG